MKVLHVIGSLSIHSGGPSRSVPQTCQSLLGLDTDICIHTRYSADTIELQEELKLRIRFLSLSGVLAKRIRGGLGVFDIIHLQHIWDPFIHIYASYARKSHIPYIITPRGMLEPWIMNKNPMKKKLAMWLYQRKDIEGAICLHATCLQEMENIRRLGFTNPVAVVPNGLDLKNVHAVKTEYGTRKIVFLSRLHPKKGIELLLDAWNKLETVGWVMEIAGEGSPDYVKSLKNRIEQSEQNNVRLVGSKYGEAKWEFLRSADLLVLPSYSENFGIVVAEALAVGVPVITTQDTPWQELEAEKCGWWIDLSLETLVAAMLEAMKLRANDLEMMGERGRVLIENNYAIESVGLKINQLYSWISKGGEKPSFVYLAK